MARLGILENAYLLVEEDKIAGFGKMEDLDREAVYAGGDIVKEIDATGRLVMPSYCDSHTHLVYAGSREIEYIDKIRGLSYEEIAKRGGGILNSCERYVKLLKKSFSMQPMTGSGNRRFRYRCSRNKKWLWAGYRKRIKNVEGDPPFESRNSPID